MHFDTVMVDRPMILQSLYQLHNTLNDRKILSWEFFLGRFDALFIEAQIQLKKSGDITHVRGEIDFNKYSYNVHSLKKINKINVFVNCYRFKKF